MFGIKVMVMVMAMAIVEVMVMVMVRVNEILRPSMEVRLVKRNPAPNPNARPNTR